MTDKKLKLELNEEEANLLDNALQYLLGYSSDFAEYRNDLSALNSKLIQAQYDNKTGKPWQLWGQEEN